MSVFRIEKNKNYTVMSNHHLRNKELSLKSKGLLSLMLSLPEEWDYTLKGLSIICKEGIDAIRVSIIELEKQGYIERRRNRNTKGQLTNTEYVIHEYPIIVTPKSEQPMLENPILDNPTQDKPTTQAKAAAERFRTVLTIKSSAKTFLLSMSCPFLTAASASCSFAVCARLNPISTTSQNTRNTGICRTQTRKTLLILRSISREN